MIIYFAASVILYFSFSASVILYFSFSLLILQSISMISFYIYSKRLFLKRKRLFDAIVVSITKKEYCSTFLIKIQKVFIANI